MPQRSVGSWTRIRHRGTRRAMAMGVQAARARQGGTPRGRQAAPRSRAVTIDGNASNPPAGKRNAEYRIAPRQSASGDRTDLHHVNRQETVDVEPATRRMPALL